jgi:BMFP domain-containing protein YqiC
MKLSNLFDDLSRASGSFAGMILDLKKEVENLINKKIDSLLAKSNFVSREEFEVVKLMAEKAREEQIALSKQIAALNKKGK